MSELPSLVLLPGMDGTGRLFQWFVPEIEPTARPIVVAYPNEWVLDDRALADLVVRQIPEGPFVLLAESFSGPIAALVAARHPAGLCGIVLAASFVAPPLPRWLRVPMADFWFRIPPMEFALRQLLLDSKCGPAVVTEVAETIRSVPPPVFAGRMQEVLTRDAGDALRSSRVPVLALAGTRDRLLGERGIETIKNARPDATVVTLDAPHMLLQAQPRAAADVIRFAIEGWLTRRPA